MPTPTSGGTASFVPYSGELLVDGLLIGTKWGGARGTAATVTYSFPNQDSTWSTNPNDGYGNPNSGWEPWDDEYGGLNGAQQAAVHVAIQAWGNVARINPVVEADNAGIVGDIRIAFTTGGDMQPDYYAYAYTPENDAPYSGDIWLNPDPPVAAGNDYSTGAAGYATLLHELGHALGLDHPFEHQQSIHDFPEKYDNYKYTVMSYSDAPGHDDDGTSSFYPTTPMLLDIQALQYLYGANKSYHTGNDLYVFEQGGEYYETIWDAGGIDTIRYDATTDGALIDLHAGRFSQLGKSIVRSNGTHQHDNVAIAYGVTVENAIGSDASDDITGNSTSNVLKGRAGGDALNGGGGYDTLNGDSGNDTLNGGSGNDTLNGGSGSDTMAGGSGSDVYIRDAAGDLVTEEAGAGADKVKSAVTYTLGPNVENLTLTGANAVNGSGNALDNVLKGNGAKNTLKGGEGDDVLRGLGAADVLKGGAGEDRFDFDAVADSGIYSSKRDTIVDFTHGEDRIDLSTIDAKSSTAGNDAFKFIGTKAFSSSNASGQLRFDADLHLLLGSTNADSAPEFTILVSGINSMTGSNFIL